MNTGTGGGEHILNKMAKESFMRVTDKLSQWIVQLLRQSSNKCFLSAYHVLGAKSHHLHIRYLRFNNIWCQTEAYMF